MMGEKSWVEIDHVISRLFASDPITDSAIEASERAGLPAIELAPSHAKLLMLLAMIRGARTVLEIGTLGGYSTIWMARALPADGRLISLESDRRHAELARANVERAGFAEIVDIRVGLALDLLAKIAEEGAGPFDMIFIDADKENNHAYFEWALKLSQRGSVIVADNVVRFGAMDTTSRRKDARSFMQLIADEPRVSATAIQTVSIKGHDGFALAVVK